MSPGLNSFMSISLKSLVLFALRFFEQQDMQVAM